MNDRDLSRRTVAERLRMARNMAGLTQGQVAAELDWHRPTVSEIEAGRRRVKIDEVARLADLYGVNIPWVIGRDGSDSVSDKAKLAARELGKLRDQDLDRLLEVIQALKTTEDA